MAKTANLYARIEPEVKEQAEEILSQLGLSSSNAINLFYKQIIMQHGLPFEIKIPTSKVSDISVMSEKELDAELEKGYQDIAEGRTKPFKNVFDSIREDYKF